MCRSLSFLNVIACSIKMIGKDKVNDAKADGVQQGNAEAFLSSFWSLGR